MMYGMIKRRERPTWRCKGRETVKINERERLGDGGKGQGRKVDLEG